MTFWGIGGIYIQFNMEEETYLAIYYDDFNQKIKTSINEVKDWLDNNNKEDLSNFIYHRLHSRY